MRFAIAPLDNGDLKSLFRTGTELFAADPPAGQWSDTAMADLLSRPESVCLVAKERKKILGFLAGEIFSGSHALVQYCAVREHPVHEQILIKLMDEFIALSKARSAEKINFTLDRESVHLLKFCATLGFQEQRNLVEMTLDIKHPAE